MRLRALATRWHSDDQPGWVEVVVRDARGHEHRIIEKAPVVTSLDLAADSDLPIVVWLEAEVESADGSGTVVTLPHGIETTAGERSLAVVPFEDDRAAYLRDRRWLDHAVHELPAGVLWGANGATPAQCAELLVGLDEFARVCARLWLDDHAEFVEACRWHFQHYPHYLGRRRHFSDYATYVRARRGPLRVPAPQVPGWLHGR